MTKNAIMQSFKMDNQSATYTAYTD